MNLIRHVAAIPTATEQRCLRCCEVIKIQGNNMPQWPTMHIYRGPDPWPSLHEAVDCTPHDPHAEGDLTEDLGRILAEALERAQ